MDRKITAAYNDKINGVIDESLWQMTHDRLSAEKRKVEDELRVVNEERGDYLERGVLLIELVQNTENAYKKATASIKRKIIEIVSSNHVLEDGNLRFDYRKPFDLLVSAHSKEKWLTLAAAYRTFFRSNPHFDPNHMTHLSPSVTQDSPLFQLNNQPGGVS